MSLMKSVLCLCMGLLIVLSCEDTHSTKKSKSDSKKKNEVIQQKTEQSPKKTRAKDTVSAIDTISTNEKPFKLTNKNLRKFMKEYGKDNPEDKVRISTKFGDIDIKLHKETPLHRANFIYLVKQKYFDETFFYRVAKGFVIQGGNSDRQEMAVKRFEIGEYTIPQEPIAHLKHVRGAVALSKQWVDNPSNRSTPFEFFIVVSKNGAPHLDGEHTIFGKVTKGMNVVDKISNVPVDGSEWPKENIFIKATVIK